jgi:hypothetical protein
MFMLVRIVEVSECRTGAVEFLCYFYLDDAERMLYVCVCVCVCMYVCVGVCVWVCVFLF